MPRTLAPAMAAALSVSLSFGVHAAETHPSTAHLKCDIASLVSITERGVALTNVQMKGDSNASRCVVQGTITTSGEGAPDGTARFELNLPGNWNGRFIFLGGGGFDGNVPQAPVQQLGQGYVTLGTDSGYVQDPKYPPGADASAFVSRNGQRNQTVWVDYAYRSRSQVNAKVRPLVSRFYAAEKIERAYFVGCSGGGREALVEAQRNPDAYDGFIAGNPLVDAGTALLMARNFRVLMDAPIPYSAFPALAEEVLKQCDSTDGVTDGLIQNPAACAFSAQPLVDRGVLTSPQASALAAYLTAPRDTHGRQIGYGSTPAGMGDLSMRFPGMTGGLAGLTTYLSDGLPSNTGAQPWGALPSGPIVWLLANGGVGTIGLASPELSVLDPRIVSADGRVHADVVDRVRNASKDGLIDASQMGRFFASGHKLLIYHGLEDSILDPYQTIALYGRILRHNGGVQATSQQARLFMVPGMAHCAGGTGPNIFDALDTMEGWTKSGRAPDSIVAVRMENNMPGAPIERSMPLCPFPAQARYDGKGNVMQASSWSCPGNDRTMTRTGSATETNGLESDLKAFPSD